MWDLLLHVTRERVLHGSLLARMLLLLLLLFGYSQGFVRRYTLLAIQPVNIVSTACFSMVHIWRTIEVT